MIYFVTWLAIGGTIGWIVSVARRDRSQQDILFNLIGAATGAYIGATLIAPMMRAGAVGPYLAASVGAALALALVNVARRAPG